MFHYASRSRGGGALDVVGRRGAVVPGVLFDADAAAWRALDRKEGVEAGRYRRERVHVLTVDGREVEATTYRVTDAHRQPRHVPPTEAYVALVRRALASRGLDSGPLERAARAGRPNGVPGALFVYGTLMRGECREGLMRQHGPLAWADATASGRLVDLGEYPGLRLGGAASVYGEIVRFGDLGPLLRVLDEVEGFEGFGVSGSLYRRALLRVTSNGERTLAWTYVLCADDASHAAIPSGSWRRR